MNFCSDSRRRTGSILMGWLLVGASCARSETAVPAPAAGKPDAAAPAASALAAGFSTYHGDNTLSGFAQVTLPEKLTRLWRYKAPSAVNVTPVFGAGRVYFVTSGGMVVALDKAGNKVWSTALKAPAPEGEAASAESPGAAPIFVAGMVVVGASSGNLYGLDAATGAVKWTYETGDTIMGTPNWISVGGGKEYRVVVIAQSDGTLHCVNAATGQSVWKSEPTNRCDGSPAVQGNRIAYGNCDAAIHIFSAEDGKALKSIEVGTDKQVAGGVALAGNFVFSGNRSGSLVCGDIEKTEIAWSHEESGGELFTTPAVSADRVVYAGGDANIYGVDRKSGRTLWTFKSGGISGQSPVIAGSKVVASVDGTLYVLRGDTGEKVWSDNVADSLTSPALGDGMVVVGTGEGFVIAFGAEGGK